MCKKTVTVARIIDYESGQWWCQFYGVSFKVISLRVDTVLVKSCKDEPYCEPYNVHEFPREAVEIEEAIPFSIFLNQND